MLTPIEQKPTVKAAILKYIGLSVSSSRSTPKTATSIQLRILLDFLARTHPTTKHRSAPWKAAWYTTKHFTLVRKKAYAHPENNSEQIELMQRDGSRIKYLKASLFFSGCGADQEGTCVRNDLVSQDRLGDTRHDQWSRSCRKSDFFLSQQFAYAFRVSLPLPGLC